MYFRIGVRAHDYGRKTPRELAQALKTAGFCSAQLAISKAIIGMEQDVGRLTPGLCFEIGKSFADAGVHLAVIGCYIEPVHPDEETRKLHLRRFKEHLLFARAMGGLVVGTETTLYKAEESGREKAFQTLLKSVGELVEEAEKCGAIVGVEPVAAHTLNTPELAARLLDTVGSNHLQIIFDPVNLINTPELVRDHGDLFDRCFDAFGERIMALHCKDITIGADGRPRETLLGQGMVNYDKLADYLKVHRPGLALLREGANPETADIDIAFLKSKFETI